MPSDTPVQPHRDRLLLVATVLTVALVFMGGVVCLTESIRGCPDWPGCYGRVVPPARLDAIIEYSHRVLALVTSMVIGASAAASWSRPRSPRCVRWPPLLAIPLLGLVSMFGAMAVLRGLSRWKGIVDLGSALLVLGLMSVAAAASTAAASAPDGSAELQWRTVSKGPSAKLALVAVLLGLAC